MNSRRLSEFLISMVALAVSYAVVALEFFAEFAGRVGALL